MAQESAIDPAVPADNEKVSKADMRDNFQAAKDEIDELFVATSYARRYAEGLLTTL
jgi:hypothetical protein